MARVLVADDDPKVLDVVSTFLKAAGHEVLVAPDGAQDCAVLDRGGIDVLITDLNMPVLDGFGVKAPLATLPRPVPAIIVSGTWTADEKKKATTMGFERMYEKPADLRQLALDVATLAPKRS